MSMTRLQRWQRLYRAAEPYPHIVLDGFLPPERAARAADAFPTLADLPWYLYDNVFEKKLVYNDVTEMPQVLSDLMWDLNSTSFVALMEELSGIPELMADDSFRGGGLHCVRRGGKLDIHADFNIHPTTGLHRRLNAILFLNREWKPEYGGALELWNEDMSSCVQRILPEFNRLVVFRVDDTAFHGHPEPLQAPEGVLRKSMAWYYYSAGSPRAGPAMPHSTLYQRRPGDPQDSEIERLRARRATGRLADARLGEGHEDSLAGDDRDDPLR
jgi:hypothetical protein